ncbi:hypothetical protein ACFL1G_08610, partial [Planctomycetota bacterium]
KKKYIIVVSAIISCLALIAVTVSAVSSSEQMQLSAFGVSTLKGLQAVKPMVTLGFKSRTGQIRDSRLLSESEFQSQVEKMLAEAGITIADEKAQNIGLLAVGVVGVSAHIGQSFYIFTVQTELLQNVKLVRDENIVTTARTWPNWTGTKLVTVGPDQVKLAVKKAVEEQVKTFIDDYTAANPQVKKPVIP